MFRSTTLRLTGWYVSILMLISIIFSIVVYQVMSSEVQTRLEYFESNLRQSQKLTPTQIQVEAIRINQINEARFNLSIELVYINLLIFLLGGFGSYILARRNLLPIEKAHVSQSRFTSDASHELRTPLAIMKTELEVALMDNNATVESLKETLASNLEEVDKLSKLASMLLKLSQFDNNKLALKPVNLNKITLSVLRDLKLPKKRISLISKSNLIVKVNEIAITELIRILIDNALLYSPNESKIIIKISKYNEYAKFDITNTGPGICSDKMPHIFERFFRADSSRTNGPNQGYGLGLALAKSIIEQHKGELMATSTPNDKTTFTFHLLLNSTYQANSQN